MFERALYAAAILCAFVLAAHAQPCEDGPRPIYNETFEIDRQVDPVRHVERVIVRNNIAGDYIYEFMATRTDLPETRERWTITFECSSDYVQHVEVDGAWRHSITYADAFENPTLEIAVPGQSATVHVLSPCENPAELEVLRGLIDLVDADFAIVLEITASVAQPPTQPVPPPPPNPVQFCIQMTCTLPPTWCPSQGQGPSHCAFEYACCIATCKYSHCVDRCFCTLGYWGNPPAVCGPEIDLAEANCVSECLQNMNNCLRNLECPVE